MGERVGASAWAEAPQRRVLGHAREEELPVPALGDHRDPPRPVGAEDQGALPGGLCDVGNFVDKLLGLGSQSPSQLVREGRDGEVLVRRDVVPVALLGGLRVSRSVPRVERPKRGDAPNRSDCDDSLQLYPQQKCIFIDELLFFGT